MPKSPLLVLLGGDTAQWQAWCAERGWVFLAPWTDIREKSLDLRIKSLETKLGDVKEGLAVDQSRVYLAGQGDGASAVFYVISREPDLWAAAVALGGTPRPAMDSNRLFAANTTNVPLLWLFGDKEDEALAQRLKSAGYNLEWQLEPAAKPEQVFNWLARRQRDAFPAAIDCETGAPAFRRCYWIEMTKFDPAERNDALDSTRVHPLGSGAFLAAGPFGFNPSLPGPGVLVSWLPENYQGPLKLNDRIIALGGKELPDARAYVDLMEKTFDEKPVVVMVARGKERIRIETKIVLPRREEMITARVQARYLPELKEVQVLSRAVTEMRVTLPPNWAPATVNWNGTEVAKAETNGCWLLSVQKELLAATRCP